jgi:molybdate transport system ATP-binding protein
MRFEIDALMRRSSGFRLEASLACEASALGLIGPSGSGKSTLLDAIAGVEPGARVVLDGVDCSRVPLRRRGVGYVTQDALLFPHLTVRKNLTYSPRAGSPEDATRLLKIDHLLERMPRHLSGGERRRVALARALASRPRLLLLDEPFTGLDETRRRDAMSLLAQVQRSSGVPMVLVSHRADEVVGLTDWTARLEDGKVIASGPSAELLRGGETHVDNYLVGRVSGPGRVSVDGVDLQAMIPADVEGDVRIACYAHDILLAAEAPRGLSARNTLPLRITSVPPGGDPVLIEVEPPHLCVFVTREAVASLDLRRGREVYGILKATSIVYLGPS